MAKILISNPIIANAFDGMWINQLQIILPAGDKTGILQANLLPYDGQHLLATGGKRVSQLNLPAARAANPALAAMLSAIVSEVKRQSNKAVEPAIISVIASDPSKPVVAQVMFTDKTSHRIADCFALAGTDATFAGVLNTVLGTVAVMAGLQIQS
jgi:hypothetical protein